MSRNNECLLTILRNHGDELTTAEILALTKDYPELCKGCSSGSEIISSARNLVEKGLISRIITKGGFRWSLNQQ